ncbi:hypothetical protein LCGC14_2156820 [marine sediment metagenome]|uniref:Bacteriophage T4 Gp32 single-stranded DNA-binding domain-containing protein n=1 Tax=marine sediment metagenome TaxID=412755 RepID=A0A0F9GQA1_9ZZZZ
MVNVAKRKRGSKRSKSKGFSYKPRTKKQVEERASQRGSTFDSIITQGFDTFRPKVGSNAVRILPPTWEPPHEHYGIDIFLHRNVGPDNSTYLCLAKMKNERCPICVAVKEAETAGEADEAKAIKVSKQVAMWIIDRDAEQATPMVWTMSWTIDRDFAALSYNKRSGRILLIDHPDEGYDLTFNREGQGLKTRYFGHAVDRDQSSILERPKDQQQVLEYIQNHPIPDVLNYYDADYLEKMLSGQQEEEDEDLGRKKGKKKGGKKQKTQEHDAASLEEHVDDLPFDEVVDAVEEIGLDIDLSKFSDTSKGLMKLRKAVSKALEDLPEEEDEESGYRISYGLNSRARQLTSANASPDKILGMEYCEDVVVHGSDEDSLLDDWSSDIWRDDSGALRFARHRSMANVVFADGSVKLIPPGDMDPQLQVHRDQYWNP